MLEILSYLRWPRIIQGGMGIGISLSGLSSGVTNEEGIGVIAAAAIGMNEPDFFKSYRQANIRALRKEIRKFRALSKGILGVNIMHVLTNFEDMVRTALEENVDVIFCGAGLPLDLPGYLKEYPRAKTKLVVIVSSARAAEVLCKRWLQKFNFLPDGIVAEGFLAGGHLGFRKEDIGNPAFTLEKLITEIKEKLVLFENIKDRQIPVIAAGGIYTGADIYRFQQLGADAVQMATRFVPTFECDASIEFKETYIHCKESDLQIIESPVGLPGRAIKNKFLDDVARGFKNPVKCPYHCIKSCKQSESPYCIALALINAKNGKLKSGFAFAGANAYRSDKIRSVSEVMSAIREEYKEASQ
jgi:nitronate monooxygenase